MGLKDKIDTPITVIEEVVEDGSDKYMFRGVPSGNAIAETILVPPHERANLAKLWNLDFETSIKGFEECEKFTEASVRHVIVVHRTLQPQDWADGAWVPIDGGLDVIDVAKLSIKVAPNLWLQMVAAAYKCLGLAQSGPDSTSDTFEKVVAENFPE